MKRLRKGVGRTKELHGLILVRLAWFRDEWGSTLCQVLCESRLISSLESPTMMLFDPFLDEEMMRFLGLIPFQGQVDLAGLSDAELPQACSSEMPERSSQISSNWRWCPCCAPFSYSWFSPEQKALLAPLAMPGASHTTQKTHEPNGLNLALCLAGDRLSASLPRRTPSEATCACSEEHHLQLHHWNAGRTTPRSGFLFSKIIIHPINFLGFGQDTQDKSASVQHETMWWEQNTQLGSTR